MLGSLRMSGNQANEEQRKIDSIQREINACRNEIQRLQGLKKGLYENLLSGVLTQEEFQFMRDRYDGQAEQQRKAMETHEASLHSLHQHEKLRCRLQDDAQLLRNRPELAVEVINRLIERIEITHDRHITVFYAFTDEVQGWTEAHTK